LLHSLHHSRFSNLLSSSVYTSLLSSPPFSRFISPPFFAFMPLYKTSFQTSCRESLCAFSPIPIPLSCPAFSSFSALLTFSCCLAFLIPLPGYMTLCRFLTSMQQSTSLSSLQSFFPRFHLTSSSLLLPLFRIFVSLYKDLSLTSRKLHFLLILTFPLSSTLSASSPTFFCFSPLSW